MITSRSLTVMALTSLVLASCGGRVARPVEETRDHDKTLSCDHLAAEKSVNFERMADLAGEEKAKQDLNAGVFIASPLFLDQTNVEQKEVEALTARNKVLDAEIARRNCPVPSN